MHPLLEKTTATLVRSPSEPCIQGLSFAFGLMVTCGANISAVGLTLNSEPLH